MKSLPFFILFFCITFGGVFGQTSKGEVSDPKAKAILERLRKQYDGFATMDALFTLTIELPDTKKPDTRKGKMSQQGDSYRLETENEMIISDGKTLWTYLKDLNRVQITEARAKDKNTLLSPKQLIYAYENKEFVYSLVGEATEGGKSCNLVEFKPVKRNGDYTKLRIAVDKATDRIVSIKVFGRDNSRYTMQISSLKANVGNYAPGYFTFDKNNFKGVKVEDLRMD